MPELIVYDSRNNRIYTNSRVRYRRMTASVVELVSSKKIKIRTGAIIEEVAASRVEVL